MTIDAAVIEPVRMHLVDLRTGEDREMFFNPEQLEEQLTVNYERLEPNGLPHQILQYKNTSNHGVTLDLYARSETAIGRQLMDDHRRFLLSLAYPPGSPGSIAEGGPPRVLFVWPNVFTMVVRLMSVRLRMSRFAQNGQIATWVASVTLEEDREERIGSEEVRRQGTRRSSTAGGSDA